jgi:hypothetical protein
MLIKRKKKAMVFYIFIYIYIYIYMYTHTHMVYGVNLGVMKGIILGMRRNVELSL